MTTVPEEPPFLPVISARYATRLVRDSSFVRPILSQQKGLSPSEGAELPLEAGA